MIRPKPPSAPVLERRGWLDRWLSASTDRKILSAAVAVGLLTLVAKLVAFLRDLILASSFGTGDQIDAFLFSVLIPGFAAVIVTDSLKTALLPLYVKARDEGNEVLANRLVGEITLIALVLLTAATLIVGLSARYVLPWLAPGFSDSKLQLTDRLLLVALPTIVVGGMIAIWSQLLNARQRFLLAASSPILPPLFSALCLLVAHNAAGIYAMAVGLVIGTAIQAAALATGMHRLRIPIRPRWHGMLPETGQVMHQTGQLVGANIMVTAVPVVDQVMAATLGAGSVAVLAYGSKLVVPILAVGAIAISTAIYPYFARMVAAEDWRGVRRTLKTFSILTIVCSIPVVLVLSIFSVQIVQALFQRGAFTASDTQAVAQVQAIYAFMIPFNILGVIFSRLINAMRKNRIMLIVTTLMFTINLAGDYLFKQALGVQGLALATVTHYVIACSVLAILLFRTLPKAAP